MGNCIRGSRQIRKDEEEERKQYQYYNQELEEEQEEEEMEDEFGKKRGIKVKIVLTKEELERLMFELKANGGRKLEDVLQEIERKREKIKVRTPWKPALERIIENPEG